MLLGAVRLLPQKGVGVPALAAILVSVNYVTAERAVFIG